MKNVGALAIVLATFVGCAAAAPGPTLAPRLASGVPGPPARAIRARVTRVVDGDTVVLAGIDAGYLDHKTTGRHARLIGIDTPEVFGSVGCFGRQASAFTRSALLGRDVLIDYDVDRTDRFGRALVYIWLTDGSFFNATLAEQGYASQETIAPDVRYADLFGRLVAQARDRNLGLWRSC
jgi:micrococcal nuclease